MGKSRPNPDDPGRPPRSIKIFGERNCGTNYLRQLLDVNLNVVCLRGGLPRSIRRLFPQSEWIRDAFFRATRRRNLGWKHAGAPDRDELVRSRVESRRILFVTLTKNPYAWLLALHRRPYHARRVPSSFEEFLSQPWETVGRENCDAGFKNPIELWNHKNATYLGLGSDCEALVCRYETLIEDPFGFLEGLCDEHDIQRRRRPFHNVHEAVKASDRGMTFDDYREYYLNERWRAELNDTCIELINATLDPEILSRLQYRRLDP